MILNFSADEEWPEVLPAVLPRLLINGSQGIGVTIANTWLPMNFKEVSEVIIDYLNSNVVNTDMPLIDFPSGGIIINKDELSTIHKTGKGRVVLRAKTEINYLKLKNELFISKLVVLKAYIICCLENGTSADDLFAVKLKQYKAEFEAVLALALQDKAQNGSTFINAFNAPLLRG